MKLHRPHIHRQIYCLGLIAVVVTMPFLIRWNSLATVAWGVNWLLAGYILVNFSSIRRPKLLLFFLGFYFLDALALLYTAHEAEGGFALEKHLSYLIFPLILASGPVLTKQIWDWILLSFVGACVLSLAFCWLKAAWLYRLDGDTSHFFYHELSLLIDMHAVYFSMYLIFGIGILIYFLEKKEFAFVAKWASFVIIAFFCISILFLSSKLMIPVLFLLANVFWLAKLSSRLHRAKRNRLRLGLVVLNLLIVTSLLLLPYTRARFQKLWESNFQILQKDQVTYEENNKLTGLSLRLLQWRFAFEILAEEQAWILGVAPGDAQDLMDEKYRSAQLYTGDPKRGDRGYLGYNVHNQYLEQLLRLGIFGLVYLLAYFYVSWRFAWREKNYLHLLLLFLVIAFCLTESALERNKGVVFFAFFNALFLFSGKQERDS